MISNSQLGLFELVKIIYFNSTCPIDFFRILYIRQLTIFKKYKFRKKTHRTAQLGLRSSGIAGEVHRNTIFVIILSTSGFQL